MYILLGTNSAPHDCFAILMFPKTLVFALGTSLPFHHCLWPFLERFVKHVFCFEMKNFAHPSLYFFIAVESWGPRELFSF